MTGEWHWIEATAAERALVPTLEALLALPREPAAPPNRLRRVHRLQFAGATCFLKEYRGTQWKNLLRNQLSAPGARSDAEREALVTAELQAAGVRTPRPIGWGLHRGTQYYLCGLLEGATVVEFAGHGVPPGAARELARFTGGLFAQGFALPDLSPEHVYVVARQGGSWDFGVLDLHNGTTCTRKVDQRALRRMLRRWLPLATSVGRAASVRFAARVCASAGLPRRQVRQLLESLPAPADGSRYERPGKSAAYATRNRSRHHRELALLDAVWPGAEGETVLDVPCGAGRLLPFLQARGCGVVWADASVAMIATARDGAGGAAPHAVRADAGALPFADGSVDGVVMFRFLHHLPAAAARAALAEAARVARRHVTVSFFHPCSVHGLSRLIRARLRGADIGRHAVGLGRLRTWMAQFGYELRAVRAQLPLVRDFWVASFVRRGD